MPFDQSVITELTLARDGRELFASWTSTAPAGTWFQLYADGVLAYSGTDRAAHLPWPVGARNHRISVGAVLSGYGAGGYGADGYGHTFEATTDWSGSLPAAPSPYRTLSWEGGTFLAADIAGFRIYASSAAGGAVDFTNLLATVPAYPGGIVTDGYGMGGYGHGGYGRAASTYTYQTPSLGNGTWTFAVVPVDAAGNEDAAPATVAFTVAVPPRPPAADAYGVRLKYAYNPTSHVATLSWLASPG